MGICLAVHFHHTNSRHRLSVTSPILDVVTSVAVSQVLGDDLLDEASKNSKHTAAAVTAVTQHTYVKQRGED